MSSPSTDKVETSVVKEKLASAAGHSNQSLSAEPVGEVYPGDRGDWRAVLCCVGVFFTLFIGFGILNIPGTFQTYWQENQLEGYSASEIGWIPATQFFLTLFGSVFTGRYFDLHGGRVCAHRKGGDIDYVGRGFDIVYLGIFYGESVYGILSVFSGLWGVSPRGGYLRVDTPGNYCQYDVAPERCI
jgi:hypothetical protein